MEGNLGSGRELLAQKKQLMKDIQNALSIFLFIYLFNFSETGSHVSQTAFKLTL